MVDCVTPASCVRRGEWDHLKALGENERLRAKETRPHIAILNLNASCCVSFRWQALYLKQYLGVLCSVFYVLCSVPISKFPYTSQSLISLSLFYHEYNIFPTVFCILTTTLYSVLYLKLNKKISFPKTVYRNFFFKLFLRLLTQSFCTDKLFSSSTAIV